MLRVVYEATDELPPGLTVDIRETQGFVHIRLDVDAEAEEYTRALNPALDQFLAGCGWFQVWRGEILSASSPDSPLRVVYVTDDDLASGEFVEIREGKGLVRLHVATKATAEEFAQAMNPAVAKFLAGGQWFQLWAGEIITMETDLAA